jgi:predicted nuclease of predicted toxin-antitoxin system
MWTFLVDEDMPRSTARVLQHAGYAAADVRDVGLAGRSDTDVFDYAQSQRAILVSADLGFANLLTYPLGSHAGIVVTRTPSALSIHRLQMLLVNALRSLDGSDLSGTLVIVEVGRTRVRRPPAAP